MAYEKIGFSSGQILTANNMNHIEEGIVDSVQINQGSSHVGKILVVGADGNLTLTEMPESLSGVVVGNFDKNGNIILTGELDDGTYTFRYKNTDGSYADVGKLVIGNGGTEITYTNLADTSAEAGWLNDKRFSTSSNDGTVKDSSSRGVVTNYIQVYQNQILRAKGIDFVNNVGDVYACAGRYSSKDTFVSLTYFNTHQGATYDADTNISMINLSNRVLDGEYIRICGTLVDGYTADDVIITLDEEIPDDDAGMPEPTYTNLVPTSIDSTGAVFNSTGYKEGYRLNSSCNETALTDAAVSGYILYNNQVISVYGSTTDNSNYVGSYICLYDSSFSSIYACTPAQEGTFGMVNGKALWTIDPSALNTQSNASKFANAAYIRVSMPLCAGADLVCTLDEEIA